MSKSSRKQKKPQELQFDLSQLVASVIPSFHMGPSFREYLNIDEIIEDLETNYVYKRDPQGSSIYHIRETLKIQNQKYEKGKLGSIVYINEDAEKQYVRPTHGKSYADMPSWKALVGVDSFPWHELWATLSASHSALIQQTLKTYQSDSKTNEPNDSDDKKSNTKAILKTPPRPIKSQKSEPVTEATTQENIFESPKHVVGFRKEINENNIKEKLLMKECRDMVEAAAKSDWNSVFNCVSAQYSAWYKNTNTDFSWKDKLGTTQWLANSMLVRDKLAQQILSVVAKNVVKWDRRNLDLVAHCDISKRLKDFHFLFASVLYHIIGDFTCKMKVKIGKGSNSNNSGAGLTYYEHNWTLRLVNILKIAICVFEQTFGQ